VYVREFGSEHFNARYIDERASGGTLVIVCCALLVRVRTSRTQRTVSTATLCALRGMARPTIIPNGVVAATNAVLSMHDMNDTCCSTKDTPYANAHNTSCSCTASIICQNTADESYAELVYARAQTHLQSDSKSFKHRV
jgi:hypothetical protein